MNIFKITEHLNEVNDVKRVEVLFLDQGFPVTMRVFSWMKVTIKVVVFPGLSCDSTA